MTGQRTSRNLIDWRGDDLFAYGKPLLRIERDARWPSMFRVVAVTNGWRSDVLNRTRARDLAGSLARSGSKCPPEPQGRLVVGELVPGATSLASEAERLSCDGPRADFTGTDSLACDGIAARSVGALCAKLVDAGHNPERPLHIYRGTTLALIVRSIGEVAIPAQPETKAAA